MNVFHYIAILLFLLMEAGNLFAQNAGYGTINPTHTLHVKPEASNPARDPIRLENLQPYLAATDSMVLVVDPDSGVVRVMHLDSLRIQINDADSDPANEIQHAGEVRLQYNLDLDGNDEQEINVQQALEALYQNLPKGVYKSVAEARAAGLKDGDAFLAHPQGVFGCGGCLIKLLPEMN